MDQLIKLRAAFIAGLVVLLVACGGGEDTLNGSADTGGGDDGGVDDGGVDVTPQAASLSLISQNSQIPSDSSAGTELTAIVRDSNNNFLAGVEVVFNADSGGLQVTRSITDASGQATATLDAAGDPENRIITVRATNSDSTVSDAIQVAVTGSTLSIVGPSSVTINDQVEYIISLRDSAGEGISGEDVEVTSSLGNTLGADTLTTDFNGELTVSYTATTTGDDQLSAQSLGLVQTQAVVVSNDTFTVSVAGYTANESGVVEIPIDDGDDVDDEATLEILWESDGTAVASTAVSLSTTRGVLADTTVTTDGSGQASTEISSTNAGPAVVTAEGADGPTAQLRLEFVALTPSAIDVQASPSSIGPNDSSTITAIIRDPNGNLVKNKTVRFNIVEDAGGSISNGFAVTDSLGRAQTVYTASDATSGNEGVVISAEVEGTTVNGTVSLTVADKALFVTIGSDYLISTDTGGVYSIEFAILVADSEGNPVEGVSVDLSTQPVGYSTGCLELTEENVDDEGEPQPTSSRGCGNFNGTAGKYTVYRNNEFCANEDVNFNGVTDPGEDTNNNGVLDPGTRAVIDPNIVTDASGRGLATFTYSAEYAFWYSYVITAVARSEGTETSHTASGVLPALASDLEGEGTPPNEESPYGIGDC